MADEERNQPRPLWVRCVARDGTKRPAAQAQIRINGIFGCGGLFYACGGLLRVAYDLPSNSFMAANALPIGLTFAGLGAAGVIWCWLAIRWVDRNGRWA